MHSLLKRLAKLANKYIFACFQIYFLVTCVCKHFNPTKTE